MGETERNQVVVDAQRRLVELDKKKAEIKAYYEDLEQVLAVLGSAGLDWYFQSEDGTVYKIVKPVGKFVSFADVDYLRTRREGEAKGSLSIKEAEAAGYSIKTGKL
jgi:hypothetical protein